MTSSKADFGSCTRSAVRVSISCLKVKVDDESSIFSTLSWAQKQKRVTCALSPFIQHLIIFQLTVRVENFLNEYGLVCNIADGSLGARFQK
mmetsp:Transcript_34673/g.91458  ORF Transcript_34673/g.91458 Transcript_34673/m.91458 type:complete len:91 (-) Transcript_34673:210-482(-)